MTDKLGQRCPHELTGRRFKHFKNGEIYDCLGFGWDATSDCWVILYTQPDQPIYSRTVQDFLGEVSAGVPRFAEVTN